MFENELARLFANTMGKISIVDPTNGATFQSSDIGELALLAMSIDSAMIDGVTDQGEAAVLAVTKEALDGLPPPSLIVEDQFFYFNEGRPALNLPRGRVWIPADELVNFVDLPHYSLSDIVANASVPAGKAIPRKKPRSGKRVNEHLKGKTDDEIKHLLELNQRCAVSFLGSHLRIIWQPDRSKPPKFLSVRDASARESNRIVHVKGEGGGTRKLKMFDEWMQWAGRCEFDEIRFAPGNEDPNIYNLFSGWGVEPRPGNWALLRTHICWSICNGNYHQFNWLMAWLADMFQHPERKPTVAVVIRGLKGTGKSIIFDFLQALMPNYFYKVADGNRALGNFNAAYENTICLLMEEAIWAGDHKKEGALKDLITSPTMAVERKGVDSYMAKNHMRIAMLSNERWVVPATVDERRFAVFDCGAEHRGDTAYFNAMSDQMKAGGLEAMLGDLLTFVPDGGWDILRTPPVTSGLREQMVESLRGIDRFMHELLVAGMYECDQLDEGGIFLAEDRSTSVPMKELRAAARDYLADNYQGQKAANFNLIDRAVREWFGADIVTRRAHQNEVRWVDFPSLAECREHVRRTKGMQISAPIRSTDTVATRRSAHLRAVPTLN